MLRRTPSPRPFLCFSLINKFSQTKLIYKEKHRKRGVKGSLFYKERGNWKEQIKKVEKKKKDKKLYTYQYYVHKQKNNSKVKSKYYLIYFLSKFLKKNTKKYNSSFSTIKQILTYLIPFSTRKVTGFFEKPGVYILDWIAYLFLVEWSTDLTKIIPENFDIYINTTTSKFLRILHVRPFAFNLGFTTYRTYFFSTDSTFHNISQNVSMKETPLFPFHIPQMPFP
uniref:Cell division protein n=1 Tax=Haematococcus lacustris TaxID=44745 RepID=A0A2K9YRY7_HAELA|nr:cell division protein [Haematococcus lacustris]AUW36516.1 cell division protein [Haematococcus lacustris]